MTQFNYSGFASTASRLLQQFGSPATINHPSDPVYDPSTGQVTSGQISTPCTATVMQYKLSNIDGTLVQQGDQQAYVSPVGLLFDPQVGDTFIWTDGTYKVMSVQKIAPAGTVVLWILQVRTNG